MSKYTAYYNTRQAMYKDFAVSWANVTKDMNFTEDQRRGMTLFFRPIARRFGLIREFKDLTII